MALETEDDGVFVWPPIHWPTSTAAPELEPPPIDTPEQIAATSPAPPVELPQPVLPPPVVPLEPEVDAVSAAAPIVPQVSEVDAVSGVDAPIIPLPVAPAPTVEEPPAPESPYLDELDPSSWAKPLSSADLYTMAKRDPVGFAQHVQAMDKVRATEQRRLNAEVDTANRTREEQIHQDFLDSQREAQKLHDQILNTKINPNRVRESRGPLQSIAAMIAVVVGGLYQARKGGPNIGLEILDKEVDRDIAAQEAELANRRGALAELRAQGMSRFQAAQAYRVAVYQHAKEDVLTKMQDYDPAGTTARNLAQQALEIESRIGQSAEVARRNKLDEELKRRKDDRESLETLAKLRESDAKLAKMKGGAGAVAGVIKPGNLSRQDIISALGPNANVNVPAEPPGGFTPAHAKQITDLAKSTRDVKQFETDEQRKEAAEVRELGVGGLVNKDEKPFKARDKAVAEKLTKQKNAAEEVSDIIDEILMIRDRSGGESKVFNSDDSQRLQVLQNRLVILEKGGTEGMSSDEDMKKLSAAIGAADVSSFRARAAGLEKGRERTVGFLNQTLKNNGYTGPAVTVPNRFANAPKKSQHEVEMTKLIAKPQTSVDEADRQATAILRKKYPAGKLSDADAKALNAEARAYASDYKDVSPEQKADYERKGVIAAGTGPEAEKAKADLEYIVVHGQTPRQRELAQAALKYAPAAPGPTTSTAPPVDLSIFSGGAAPTLGGK